MAADAAPEPGAILVYDSTRRFASWTIDLRQFSNNHAFRLWALTPKGEAAPAAKP
jgi:hypothetical protein